ncbi:MAG: ribosome maturation factor RimM [Bacteroidia bacterium]
MNINTYPDYFHFGYIVRTHGVKGDFIVALESDSPDRYKALKVVYLEIDEVLKEYNVTKISIKEKERSAYVHLQGIEDMTTAENYLKFQLYLPLSSLPKLKGKKFYFHEVMGFTVVDKTRGALGPICSIFDRTIQPVIEFDYQEKKVLFPLHQDLLIKIDREAKEFHVDLPEGLVEIYLES